MSKNNYKKVEFQIKDVSASNFLCGENLLSYVKSNLYKICLVFCIFYITSIFIINYLLKKKYLKNKNIAIES
jgi:hypothetical protein